MRAPVRFGRGPSPDDGSAWDRDGQVGGAAGDQQDVTDTGVPPRPGPRVLTQRWQQLRQQLTLSSVGLEIGIVGATVAAMFTVNRLFTAPDPVVTMAVAALLSHGVAISCRWAKLPWILSALISAFVVTLSVLASLFPDTVRLRVIPSPSTVQASQRALIEAWNTFMTVRAPTAPLVGFTLIGVAGAWLISTLTDAIAYRLGFLIEALVPSAVVVVLSAALATDDRRVVVLLPYVAAVCLVVGSARVRELARDAWLGAKPRRAGALGAVILVLTSLSAVAVTASRPPAWVVDGLIDLQANSQASSRSNRTASNPLVTTRAHLVTLADEDLFIAKTDVRAYWRLTALDTYTDDQWTASRGIYREEETQPQGGDRTVDITFQGLSDTWLPVQMPLRAVGGTHPDGLPATLSIDRYSDSVLLDDQARRGDRYTVTVADASEPSGSMSSEQLARLRVLPSGIAARVTELAVDTTANAVTDLERMQALESFFRTQFTYDLDIARSASLGLEQFLFDVRRGYCEQFASSFAVMARILGLPSRVAIGFVPGTLTDAGYQVKGKDAHAWPEVYLNGSWVAFEPTPNRARDDAVPSSTTLPPTTNPSTPPTSAAAPGAVPTTVPASPDVSSPLDEVPATSFGLIDLAKVLLVGLGLVGLWFLPWAVRRLRSPRNVSADSESVPSGLATAWRGLEDDLAWHGAVRSASEPTESWLARVHRGTDVDWGRIANAARRIDAVRYGEPSESATTAAVADLGQDIEQLRRDTVRALPTRRRLTRWLSFNLRPRPAQNSMAVRPARHAPAPRTRVRGQRGRRA